MLKRKQKKHCFPRSEKFFPRLWSLTAQKHARRLEIPIPRNFSPFEASNLPSAPPGARLLAHSGRRKSFLVGEPDQEQTLVRSPAFGSPRSASPEILQGSGHTKAWKNINHDTEENRNGFPSRRSRIFSTRFAGSVLVFSAKLPSRDFLPFRKGKKSKRSKGNFPALPE